MTTLHAEVTIDAAAATVWEALAHRFDRIGEWATVIPSSHPAPSDGRITGAPVAGRVCHTGLGLVPEVTERFTAYDEDARTFTYEAENMPGFLRTARNQWRVIALDEHRTIASLDATLQVRGVLGRILYPVLRLRIAHMTPRFLHDLKHYVEHGKPSPRKQRQLHTAPRPPGPRAQHHD